MNITAKLSVAGAAAIFGVVIAAGAAFAAGGSTLVADTPGSTLQVRGIGSPSAEQSAASADLKIRASTGAHLRIETVVRAHALPIDGSTNATNDLSRPGVVPAPPKRGSDGTPDKSVREAIPAIPATPAVPGGADVPATPAVPPVPSVRTTPHGLGVAK